MKMAPVLREATRRSAIVLSFVHTGQHYDDEMSEVFLEDLGLPQPDACLGASSGSHAQQTVRILVAFEEFLAARKADMVIVGGDVDSTLACSLVAAKLQIPIAHVEAGLRSFDRTMPEEVNRVVTDTLSDLLFTTCEDANANLEREGIPKERIHFVGNTMIDTLKAYLDRALNIGIRDRFGVEAGGYALLTLHRPSNVDTPEVLSRVLDAIERVQGEIQLLFPVHPRTRERIQEFGLTRRLSGMPNLHLLPPLRYLEFLALMAQAKLVLTDSGGIQEETTVVGIPCVTLRWNTERPVTIREGTNVLAGNDPTRVTSAVRDILSGEKKPGGTPKLWDGGAAMRIVDVISDWAVRRQQGRRIQSGGGASP